MNLEIDNNANTQLSSQLNEAINKHINVELTAFYFYMGCARYFERHDVALHNVAKFFNKQCNEEKEHGEIFQKYLVTRLGKLELFDIKIINKPYSSILEAMQISLELEKMVYDSLLQLHKLGEDSNDPQFTDFIEGTFLKEQVESIKEFNDYITNLKRVGDGMGEYLFDKYLDIE